MCNVGSSNVSVTLTLVGIVTRGTQLSTNVEVVAEYCGSQASSVKAVAAVAVIEGRNGFYEVYAGDPIPGLGRVNEIRRQDGRWVVVTTKGLVVSR